MGLKSLCFESFSYLLHINVIIFGQYVTSSYIYLSFDSIKLYHYIFHPYGGSKPI